MEGMAAGQGGERGELVEDLRSGLAEVARSRELSDIRLHGFVDALGVGTMDQIHAHKLVLALRSPVCRARLRPGGAWYGKGEVVCADVPNYQVMRALVDFLYTDVAPFQAEGGLGQLRFAGCVHEAARAYQIVRLERLASEALAGAVRSSGPNADHAQLRVPASRWFSAVLAVLQFAMRMTEDEGCADPELGKTCIDLVREAWSNAEGAKPALLRAMHDPVESLVDRGAAPCLATVCSEVLLAVTDVRDESMELAVLSGRADIVLDLLARGVDPDAPSSTGALPVELALQLGKACKPALRASLSSGDFPYGEQLGDANPSEMAALPGFEVGWVNGEEMDQIVETLILGGSRDLAGKNKGKRLSYETAVSDHEAHQHPMLNLAARLGNARHVQALLNAGQDVNERDPVMGRSPLHCAAEAGFEDVVRVLLDAGTVPNQQDDNGCTGLHLACRRGHVGVVELLLPQVNENIPDNFGWTSLHHAARKGHAEITRLLLQMSEHPLPFMVATEYDQGSTAAHLAACHANYRVILVMLDCARELDHSAEGNAPRGSNLQRVANATDLLGRTPLHRAVALACDSVERDAQPDETFSRACKVIETLLDAGADITGRTKLGYVPLHFAVGGQRCHVLRPEDAPVDPATVESGYAELRQQVHQEAGPYERQRQRLTAMLLSILLGTPGGGASVTVAGLDGVTPLHCAVRYNHLSAVPALIRRGADVNARDQAGDSPLTLAREHWPMALLANSMLKVLPAAPSWVNDTDASQCQSCGAHWSVTTRRHHCRHCSSLVCASCSVNRMPIPKYSVMTPVRICNSCHEALSWPNAAHDPEDADLLPLEEDADDDIYNFEDAESLAASVSVADEAYAREDADPGALRAVPPAPDHSPVASQPGSCGASVAASVARSGVHSTTGSQVTPRRRIKVKPRKAAVRQVSLHT